MYVARDAYGELYWYDKMPELSGPIFRAKTLDYGKLPEDILPEVTFEDSPKEVKSIKIKLKD